MKVIKGIINVLTTLIIIIGGIFLILYVCGFVPYVVLSYNKIQEKDIIAFKHKDGTLVTHRAVKVTKSGIKTKGDNNKDIDGNIVKKENFVGKNILWIPKVGYIVKKFQTTKGVIILITCVVLLLVSGLLFGEDDKKTKEKNN